MFDSASGFTERINSIVLCIYSGEEHLVQLDPVHDSKMANVDVPGASRSAILIDHEHDTYVIFEEDGRVNGWHVEVFEDAADVEDHLACFGCRDEFRFGAG